IGDGLQRDAWNQTADFLALPVLLALIDEVAGRAALRLLQLVPREGGGQKALPCQGQWHAGSIAGDPATAPLFGDIGGSAGAAGGVQDNVARIGGHQNAALDNFLIGLHYIDLVSTITTACCINPCIAQRIVRKVINKSAIRKCPSICF